MMSETVSVRAKAISSFEPPTQKNFAEFEAGNGIKKVSYDAATQTIKFEIEEEFHHTLRTISGWKGITPERYLSEMFSEYILQKSGKY